MSDNPLKGWSQQNQDILRDFVRAFAGRKPAYTITEHPSCRAPVAAVNMCWKHDNFNIGRYQVLCTHQDKHFHFLTEPLSRFERTSIAKLRSVLQERARATRPSAARTSASQLSQTQPTSSQASTSTAVSSQASSSAWRLSTPSSSASSEIEIIDPPLPAAVSSSLRVVIFYEHNGLPTIFNLPWPATSEYFSISNHVDHMNGAADVRHKTIVKPYNGRLTSAVISRLSAGLDCPTLFAAVENWGSEILFGDVMLFERPALGYVVFGTPSTISVLEAREELLGNARSKESHNKGKRKASCTSLDMPSRKR
ncbi:hypothetical protein PENSPDRAFT_694603 [Peniophora sp. CONT]|nr:hypothetical protein PENSPDRAFT_694603 [Peniophora sp. CONT]